MNYLDTVNKRTLEYFNSIRARFSRMAMGIYKYRSFI